MSNENKNLSVENQTEIDLRKLKHRRGVFKGQVTAFKTFLSKVDTDNLTTSVIENIKSRIKNIEPVLELFNEIQSEIEFTSMLEEPDIEERSEFADKFHDVMATAVSIIKSCKTNTSSVASSRSSEKRQSTHSPSRSLSNNGKNAQDTNIVYQTQPQVQVRLPTINLPTFNGDFTLWREYFDAFSALIDKNSQLSPVQKLSYLKSSLKNEPANLIRSFETTADNYDVAWSLLQKRYNNKRRIVNNHVQALLDIPKLQRDSYTTLRQIIDIAENHMQCLRSLGQPIEQWDALIIPIISRKLDFQTNKDWESKINTEYDNEKIPTFLEFLEFLNSRQNTLEAIFMRKTESDYKGHYTQNCEEFRKLNEDDRNTKARELKLCLNCLKKGHFIQNCLSKNKCKQCQKKHHSLLHRAYEQNTKNINQQNEDEVTHNTSTMTTCSSEINQAFSQVLLSTAVVLGTGTDSNRPKNSQKVRLLLDSCSQSSYLTEHMCDLLNLKKIPVNINVSGIANEMVHVKYKTFIKIKSAYNDFSVTVSCLILPKITTDLMPNRRISLKSINVPKNIKLADPTFNIPGEIDMLIGAEIFWSLLCVGQIRENCSLVYQKTKLGWIVSGNVHETKQSSTTTLLSLTELHKSVERFWQHDEFLSKSNTYTNEEKYCENFYKQTTCRDKQGKFIVKIPIKENIINELGDSENVAKERLSQIERRFERDVELKQEYTKFMEQYISLGHMTKIAPTNERAFYLPHHPVFKGGDKKAIRVVFDGSCHLNKGLNINELQYTGPTIQNDLFSIIARFRTFNYVITADVEKMYRQVWVHSDDRKYQRILWRFNENEEISHYELNTVTYGLTSSPFLAIRCLQQLALENEEHFPVESEIIKNCSYVDDFLFGSDSKTELQEITRNIINILNNAGFNLRKFRSNVSDLLIDKSPKNNAINHKEIFEGDVIHKTLGIYWNPELDIFTYPRFNVKRPQKTTKRNILAVISQLFDPLGILSPAIVIGKLILQELWQLKLDWDESVPVDLQTKWLSFLDSLERVNEIEIPRSAIIKNATNIELHVFSDASTKAYGACIYLVSRDKTGSCQATLLAAKSRVCPLKTVTLPRLELSAAVIAAQLASRFKEILNIKFHREFYWCDSQIVLAWLKSLPVRWKTYVANRVAEIQNLSNIANWHYIKSENNAADVISRGKLPSELINSPEWFHGPAFLRNPLNVSSDNDMTCSLTNNSDYFKEEKTVTLNTFVNENKVNSEEFIICRFSNLRKLIRITALCQRFSYNCRHKQNKRTGIITKDELDDALSVLVRMVQSFYFTNEIDDLRKNNCVDKKSSLLSLTPFIDEIGIIRVGGRIKLSEFSYNKKHPIVLPRNSHFTNLVLQHEHAKLLHAGPTLMLASVREMYWPINGKNLCKKVVRNCLVCFRYKAKPRNPLMGNLPKQRFTAFYPFYSVGIDYAGPFLIKDRKGRGAKTSKCYICVFVCLSTKAIHLELVTELSSDAFIATFRRFIARRGKPSHVFSDNGSNFIRASKDIQDFFAHAKESFKEFANQEAITWHFIPPISPNFGGLWESSVKSCKHHLKRVLSQVPLTFEDFYTLLTQIESILNSRPLTPLTNDIEDFDILTPAHFLIGRSFSCIPDPDLTVIRESRLNRFQHLQQIARHFWDKWAKEYISFLQVRNKWKCQNNNLKVGQMVLLKENNLPPANWKLARIIAVHPGSDDIVRVATVKTASSELKRPVNKLCLLPFEEESLNN